MLGFKHNAGGFGTLGTLASDAETGRGPISLHTAIGEGAGGGRSIRFKAKSGHYLFLALFSGVPGRVILRSSAPCRGASRSSVVDRNICDFVWYGGFAGDGLRSVGEEALPSSKSVCSILPIAHHSRAGVSRTWTSHPARRSGA